MKTTLLIVMLLAFGVTSSVQPQITTNEDFCASYKKSDAQMNRLYQQILVEYRKDTLFIAKLRAAQRAWLAFTDAHVQSLYPDPKAGAYGSVNGMCRCQVMNDLTKARIQQLKKWTEGLMEGDVCAGSIKIKETK